MEKDSRVQYKFMIPLDLKKRIEHAAIDSNRSISGEIVATLEEAYPAPEPEDREEITRRLMAFPKEDRPRVFFEAMAKVGMSAQDIIDLIEYDDDPKRK